MQDSEQAVAQVADIVAGLKDKPGALLPVLHAVQERLGYIPPDTVPTIARELKLSRADVHGSSPSTINSALALVAGTWFSCAGRRRVRRWVAGP